MRIFYLILCLISGDFLFAQPDIEWQKNTGGTGSDFGKSICASYDSSAYFIAGYSSSDDGTIGENHGGMDVFLTKTDFAGNILWTKIFGGISSDFNSCVRPVAGNRTILSGFTLSNDSLLPGNHGGFDVLLILTDSSGNAVWEKVFGGSGDDGDHGVFIITTDDHDFIFVTGVASTDGDISGNNGATDIWLVRIDSTGNILWQKCYGGSSYEDAHALLQLNDGGYIFTGHTLSNDGDVSGLHSTGLEDGWVVRTDSSGNILWQRCLGGTNIDFIKGLCPGDNGSFILTGHTNSNDGDISGNHGDYDCWIIKLDSSGNTLWSKVYGGTTGDYPTYVTPDTAGGYVVGAYSNSVNGDVTGNHGDFDYWIFKIDTAGNLIWQKSYGGSGGDREEAVMLTPDNAILVTGFSNSSNGDVGGNYGLYDCWTMKLGCKEPSASFFSTDTSFCEDTHIWFINTSSDAVSYQWLLNNSPLTIAENFDMTFSNPGIDTITLIVNNGTCSDTVSEILCIYSYPVVDLGNDTAICSGCNIILDAGNSGATFSWSTGDISQMITVNYSDTFIVVVSNNGCSSSDSIIVSITTQINEGLGNIFFSASGNNSYYIYLNGKDFSCELSDVTGRMLSYQYQLKEVMINLNKYPKGIYLLKIYFQNTQKTYRLIRN